ncbi:uncharacterized protein METZ01_LOCUS349634, partial [marine metagenome]
PIYLSPCQHQNPHYPIFFRLKYRDERQMGKTRMTPLQSRRYAQCVHHLMANQ